MTSEGASPEVVGPYLAGVLGDRGWLDCQVELISGGKSNLTYTVASPAGTVVLRRPPLGHLLPTAHDMGREARVLIALADTAVPVPAVLAVCTDPAVLGHPFYVMSKVVGHVVRDSFPDGYAERPEDRAAITTALVDTLVALHGIDYPAVGLADFGKPSGYLERQLRRWSAQWEASRTGDLPALDSLAAALAAATPASPAATIVHGDYRLDNTLLDPARPGRIAAVLDWEMSTIGDPLADLGLLLVYWTEAEDRGRPAVVQSVTALPGFPTRAGVAAMYAERSGRDVTAIPWYVAFGFFKLAVVCQGIVARVSAGAMLGPGFEGYADLVGGLVTLGHEAISAG
ncbi:MAG: phosphotransferase family protein [Mycobacteriales bacterium]